MEMTEHASKQYDLDLGSIRSRLVARLAPEVLNPFDRTPEHEAAVRAAIGDILADPELDLASTPAMAGRSSARSAPLQCRISKSGPSASTVAGLSSSAMSTTGLVTWVPQTG